MKTPSALLVFLLCCACAAGPDSVAQFASAPPKPENCTLEVIPWPSTTHRWEMLAAASVTRFGDSDPFAQENTARIKPKACQLGGDAVSVTKGASSMASSISYTIWRDKRESKNAHPGTPETI